MSQAFGGLRHSQVTPKAVYLNRRHFLGAAAFAALSGAGRARANTKLTDVKKTGYNAGNEKVTPYEYVTGYNNYYEFGTDKLEPAKYAKNLQTMPWTVSIEGEVARPRAFDLDAIMKLAPLEERIYRHRCVEAWSMVIPWIGFPVSTLLKQVEPNGRAKYVAFETFYDRKQMLSARQAGIAFPYIEGLRMDEAMHPLALLSVGVYGETLPNQNGAPLRLVVPWKYGFKSIKSIVRIRLTEKQPPTTWNVNWPEAYGFYSNVNPQRDHPTHSQARERRLGESLLAQTRGTLLFNGYGDAVASLYAGMDLRRNY